MKRNVLFVLCLVMASLSLKAQNCDPWITKAYSKTYKRTPTAEECNIKNYNGGTWSSYPELVGYIATYNNSRSGNHLKGDPWIFQAYAELYDRAPRALELNINLYNGGTWNSYAELKGYVQEMQNALQRVSAILNEVTDGTGLMLTNIRTAINNALALINNNGQIVAQGDDVLSRISATMRQAAEGAKLLGKKSGNKGIKVGRKTYKLLAAGGEVLPTSGAGAIILE